VQNSNLVHKANATGVDLLLHHDGAEWRSGSVYQFASANNLVLVLYNAEMLLMVRMWCSTTEQMQEFKTGATRQNMETTHMKEETKRLRSQLGELRDKLTDLDAKVTNW